MLYIQTECFTMHVHILHTVFAGDSGVSHAPEARVPHAWYPSIINRLRALSIAHLNK